MVKKLYYLFYFNYSLKHIQIERFKPEYASKKLKLIRKITKSCNIGINCQGDIFQNGFFIFRHFWIFMQIL